MIVQSEDESRLEYLGRVLEQLMELTIAGEQTIDYDDTTCDGVCLAEDINIEIQSVIIELMHG